jgi:hypothetical protein
MTANTSPIFTLTPRVGECSVAAANTASDGSGALVTLFTAGSNGSRFERITWQNAQATAAASSAMVARFFVTDTGGINPKLFLEVAIPAATRSTSAVGAAGYYVFPNGMTIASGNLIQVIQSVYAGVQDLMHYTCWGGDF